ncbi:MAG: monooxygenase [Alphaproteobacteria bacterium]|nr:monooxygenase [Alphaproteobacteria bacterium]
MSFALLLALAGCESAPTWHADVQPILEGRCAQCHQAGAIAPFALTSYEEAAPLAELIAATTSARTMPPWGADSSVRAYLGDPSLTDEQIATIEAWAAAGAPEGDPEDAGEPLEPVAAELDRVDLSLEMPERYDPEGQPEDDYRCFALDWTEDEPVFVTGFNVVPGNNQIVHHVAAYLFSSDNLMGDALFDALDEWDQAEAGPGYTCFGGPSGPGADLQVPVQQLAQWVPGMGAVKFPEGTGIHVDPGSKVVLQVHYWEPGDPEGDDATAIELQVEPEVERYASFAPWLDPSWVGGDMRIPAGDDDVKVDIQRDPRSFFSLFIDENVDMRDGFDVHSVLFHMHTLGKSGELALVHEDGSEEMIISVPEYDFNWQFVYRLAEPVRVAPGEELRLECHFDNSAENQADGGEPEDVNWGEGTTEEMCVANMYITGVE